MPLPLPVAEYTVLAPAVFAALAPVFEYVAPTPVDKHIAPAPAAVPVVVSSIEELLEPPVPEVQVPPEERFSARSIVPVRAVHATLAHAVEYVVPTCARHEDQSVGELVPLVAAPALVDEVTAPKPAVNYATPVPKVEHATPVFTLTATDLVPVSAFKVGDLGCEVVHRLDCEVIRIGNGVEYGTELRVFYPEEDPSDFRVMRWNSTRHFRLDAKRMCLDAGQLRWCGR